MAWCPCTDHTLASAKNQFLLHIVSLPGPKVSHSHISASQMTIYGSPTKLVETSHWTWGVGLITLTIFHDIPASFSSLFHNLSSLLSWEKSETQRNKKNERKREKKERKIKYPDWNLNTICDIPECPVWVCSNDVSCHMTPPLATHPTYLPCLPYVWAGFVTMVTQILTLMPGAAFFLSEVRWSTVD